MTVRSAAARLDSLAESSGAKWLDYDRQWNEIMPSAEDMQINLARLETMQSALSPAQRAELDRSKPLIQANPEQDPSVAHTAGCTPGLRPATQSSRQTQGASGMRPTGSRSLPRPLN